MSAAAEVRPRPVSGWLVSARFDLLLLVGPALLMVALALTLPPMDLPAWGYVLFIVTIDVAHVYATLYRTYFDHEELARRPRLYLGTPVVCLVVCLAVHQVSATLFWTLIAYMAVFHFVRQQVGFASVYRLREGVSTRTTDARVERGLLYALTGFPILWWHVHLPRSFEWFVVGDFLSGVPAWTLWPAGIATGILGVWHFANRLRSGHRAPGRDLWVLTTGAVWFGGIVLTDSDLAFTITNVVAHGLPYFALVFWVSHRKWTLLGRGALSQSWFSPGRIALFLAPLLFLAFLEEGLWDVLVWHDNTWLFGQWTLPQVASLVAVPVLAVPQVTHYVLDGFIWKLGSDNPDLRQILTHQ